MPAWSRAETTPRSFNPRGWFLPMPPAPRTGFSEEIRVLPAGHSTSTILGHPTGPPSHPVPSRKGSLASFSNEVPEEWGEGPA